MDDQNKNLILATVLSVIVLVGWLFIFPPEPPAQAPVATTSELAGNTDVSAPSVAGDAASTPRIAVTPEETRDAALAKSERISIVSERVSGSISLAGGRIDDLQLLDYNVRLNDPSEKVTLLSPAGAPNAYYTIYGWAPAGDLGFDDVPGASTLWSVRGNRTLTPQTSVLLEWTNNAGLTFSREIAIDDDYLFTVTQTVTNATNSAVRMLPYGIIARKGEPETAGFFILHEGVVRFQDTELDELDYDDLRDFPVNQAEGASVELGQVNSSGWIGFTDHYWMTTLAPIPGQAFTTAAKYSQSRDTYQTEFRYGVQSIESGASYSVETMLFAGAKEWDTITRYEETRGIEKFVDSIDWGWFFFLTKPIFRVLFWLNGIVGNMGWSIIGLTLIIKAILFPLAYKSYVSMARMKELQPEMEKIKEKAGEDRQQLQKEMMKLYKERKVNPASGCLPILLQIPIFFSLYKVIFVTLALRHEPFVLWIHDLSAPDPTSWMNLFGIMPWGSPDPVSIFGLLSIGVFPILMGVTMWMQQKLNPSPTDATQAMIFAWMPWVFMFMLGRFASGLVLYWVANNTITFIQQYSIMRSQGVKPDILGNIFKAIRARREAGSK
jgi:YidC/Oxa1 family membrane protein insertase